MRPGLARALHIAVSVTGPAGFGHKTLLYLMPAAPGVLGGCRCGCSAGIKYNNVLCPKPEASFMTAPNEASPSCARAVLFLSRRMAERSGPGRRWLDRTHDTLFICGPDAGAVGLTFLPWAWLILSAA